MYQRSPGGRVLEILLFTISSLLLYHTGIGLVLFLVPMQVIASRRGTGPLLAAEGAFLLGCLVIRFWPLMTSGGQASIDFLVWIELGVITLLLLGLLALNVPLRRDPGTLLRLIAVSCIAMIAGFPAILLLSKSAAFQQSMDGLFSDASTMLSTIFAPASDGMAGSLISSLLQPARLRQISEAVLLRSMLLYYTALLTFSWWAGQAAARRTPVLFGNPQGFQFARFKLASYWLWPLIASGAVVLVDLFFGVTPWAYAAWNIGLVVLFLYGLQGMAIIWFLFQKYNLPRFLWVILVVGLGLCAMSPSVGLFIILAIPVLGIAETWIRLRIPRDTAPKSET